MLKDGLLNSRLICSSGNRGPPETKTEAGPEAPAKKRPVWMPQWHVKECYGSPVPTLPVADALCQHIFPPMRCLVSGQRDSRQTPIMCLHQASCPLALIPGGMALLEWHSSQGHPMDCGWCKAVNIHTHTHTHVLMDLRRRSGLMAVPTQKGNNSGREGCFSVFLPSSNACALATLF